jgi:hypothetical protein
MIAAEISHCLLRYRRPISFSACWFDDTEEKRPTRGCVSHERNERAIYDGADRATAASSAVLSTYPLSFCA